jgi:hypothetical protein
MRFRGSIAAETEVMEAPSTKLEYSQPVSGATPATVANSVGGPQAQACWRTRAFSWILRD